MEGSNPVISGAQRELIEKYAGVLGEAGKAIEEEARMPGKLPMDVFRLIESCLNSLGQRAKKQGLSNKVIRQREPERLLQVEAIREHANMLRGARLNGDRLTEGSIRQSTLKLIDDFMTAVDKDKEDGLDLDTARMWKDQVHEIATQAKVDQLPEGASKSKAGPSASAKTADRLAPLKSFIEQATYTMEATARELQDPDETILRGFGKQLGSSKKEIMSMSKDLMMDQSAGVAVEAARLANEACDAIKASRESIRAALRELGAASDISEASGPTRAQWPTAARPVVGNVDPGWAAGARPAAAGWAPAHTPAVTAWPPREPLPIPRMSGADGELTALMWSMMNAQANDSGWPTFSGKYVEYPRFRREWWAYRQTYHGHVRDELVCRSLKERSLASYVRLLVNNIDDLREAWNTLDTCFDRPEKYISEALDPVIKFRSYKAFDNGAIREFYSILRAAMMGARKAGLLGRLINDQTLPSILAKMPLTDWRQWAKERPAWMREAIEEAFWNFVDQKWRDALNVAAAEPPAWGAGSGGRTISQDNSRKEAPKPAKPGAAAVHVTGVDGKRHRQGDSGRTCVFKDVMGCTTAHPPWLCKVFGKLPAGEREKIIVDNRLCPFCLLHDKDKPCGAKQRQVSVACTTSNCKGRHIQKLHDFLKDVFREENRVHVVHGDDGWKESDEAWEIGEEEMMIVGTVQQDEEYSWQDACNSWAEQEAEEAAAGVHQVSVCQGSAEIPAEGQCKKASALDTNGKANGPDGLLLEGEEQEYFLELLMRRTSPERPKAGLLAESGIDPSGGAATTRGKGTRKRKKEKKVPKKAQRKRKPAGETGRRLLQANRRRPEEANNPRPGQQPGGQGQGTGWWPPREGGAAPGATSDLRRGVFRTEDAGLFLRSSL